MNPFSFIVLPSTRKFFSQSFDFLIEKLSSSQSVYSCADFKTFLSDCCDQKRRLVDRGRDSLVKILLFLRFKRFFVNFKTTAQIDLVDFSHPSKRDELCSLSPDQHDCFVFKSLCRHFVCDSLQLLDHRKFDCVDAVILVTAPPLLRVRFS